MKLIPIPEDKYAEYRLNAIFDCYKWDPQFKDNNTLAKHALVISSEEYLELKRLTEDLAVETIAAEQYTNKHLKVAKRLKLPKKLYKELKSMNNYDASKHIRLMRFDFHPTTDNYWAVSEVNSDVPGGFAEASLLPQEAINILSENNKYTYINFGDILVEKIASKVIPKGNIMLVHCTCFSDDRQVMQYLGDKLCKKGFNIIYGAADHIRFKNKIAYSILDGNETKLDGIFRFNPLEWVIQIKPKHWSGFFCTSTPSCNHPIAIYAQTKRFPLIWNELEKSGLSLHTWRTLLPDTIDVKDVKEKEGYIYKPACGRVGEKISIKEACSKQEYEEILKDVKRHPQKYIAQKKFISKSLNMANNEAFHVCIGSYTVDGKHAGFYARISRTPRIDSSAADIPVLIEGEH